MITLYDFALSGHAHRVRLLLSLLGLSYQKETVDLARGEHQQPSFMALNPLGQVPVLCDGDVVLRDSAAILVYLAMKYDSPRTWLPEDPLAAAHVQQWLATAAKDLAAGPAAARRIKIFNTPEDYQAALNLSIALLSNLYEPHLASHSWLAAGQPTIADVANYSYIATAPEGGVDLLAYPNVRAWLQRVESLPGFEPMPGFNSNDAGA